MTVSLSIRFEAALLDRLRQRAAVVAGETASGLAQRLVDEGLRVSDHPGVVFKDGPSGRRAALAMGPDVWEVVSVLKDVDERGQDAVDAAAEILSLDPTRIETALRYYGNFPAEIDGQIEAADQASRAAETAWRTGRRLLA